MLGSDADEDLAGSSTTPTGSTFIGGVPMNWATNTDAGRAYTSCGVPTCSRRPRLITATWVPIVIASTWSWVT